MSKWTDFLDENYCHEEYLTGNRPCDSGVLCDTCQSDAAQRMYKEYLKRFPEEVKTKFFACGIFPNKEKYPSTFEYWNVDPAYWRDRYECFEAIDEKEAFEKFKKAREGWLSSGEMKHIRIVEVPEMIYFNKKLYDAVEKGTPNLYKDWK